MTVKNKIGSIAVASLATIIVGSVSTNHIGNSGSDNVSITYDQLVEQTTVSCCASHSFAPMPETTPAVASRGGSTTSEVTASQEVTTVASEPVIIEDEITVTVYVSSSGKYHSKSNCSGMKYYTEMSLEEAIEAGHIACKKCW